MADIHDVTEADKRVDEALSDLQATATDPDAYLATQAICYAIQAAGIRFDYVLRDIARHLER